MDAFLYFVYRHKLAHVVRKTESEVPSVVFLILVAKVFCATNLKGFLMYKTVIRRKP